MTTSDTHTSPDSYRAELLVELTLQELKPMFVARPSGSSDFGVDFFVGFRSPRGGINLSAVEVKATQKEVNGRFPISKRLHGILAASNIPVVLMVADTKRNQLYWGYREKDDSISGTHKNFVGIAVRALDESSKGKLRDYLAHYRVPVAT